MTTFAYIRVSTDKQTSDNQRQAINEAGYSVDKWFAEEGVSGTVAATERSEFKAMMKQAKEGDTVIIVKIDRLGRKAGDILNTVELFKQKGIKLRVMQFDGVDLTSAVGKVLLAVMSAMAELERDILSERTKSGISRTKAQGTIVGRMNKIPYQDLEYIVNARNNGIKMDVLCEQFKLGRSTINNALNNWKDKLPEYKEHWEKQCVQLNKIK